MAQNNTVSTQKITQAAGNNMALLEVLQSITTNAKLQQQVTNTTGKNVPPQCKATVSVLNSNYIVQIQNPGAIPATSALQAAQAAQVATSASNTAAITSIYHQIRCATTPRFSISDNVQTFGGDSGSTQTYWTITNLGAGQFYFQIRSSYDGTNWNLWKNANGGQALTSKPSSITVETVENGVFAVFDLPGKELVAFGAGLCANNAGFTLPEFLYSSAMKAIPGPNGYTEYGHPMHGVNQNEVDIDVPIDTSGLVGPPDYPIIIPMTYEDGNGNIWPGLSNFFSIAYDPLGSNITEFQFSTGNWAVFSMPGGWQIAFGSGQVADSTTIQLPAGFDAAHMLSIPSPASFTDTGHPAHGISNCSIDNTGKVNMQYADGSGNTWTGNANWMAVAFTPGVPVTALGSGNFLEFVTPGGNKVAIGAGNQASGTNISLPPGYTTRQMLALPTPSTFNDTGHPAHGVANCSINGPLATLNLTYQDNSDNSWDGNANWFCFVWQ